MLPKDGGGLVFWECGPRTSILCGSGCEAFHLESDSLFHRRVVIKSKLDIHANRLDAFGSGKSPIESRISSSRWYLLIHSHGLLLSEG